MRSSGCPALLIALLLIGCLTGLGVQVVQPPPLPPEPPMPSRLTGEVAPELEATSVEGLFRASAEAPHLYYYAPDELWYRYWRGKWYQAFLWNGAWFPPRRTPEALRSVAPTENLDEEAPRPRDPPR